MRTISHLASCSSGVSKKISFAWNALRGLQLPMGAAFLERPQALRPASCIVGFLMLTGFRLKNTDFQLSYFGRQGFELVLLWMVKGFELELVWMSRVGTRC